MSAAEMGPGAPEPPRVLVSRDSFTAFADVLTTSAPAARFLVADPDGTRAPDGTPIRGGVHPDAGWFSSDLFEGGRGAAWFVRHLKTSTRLRWVHSSTAGTDGPFFELLRSRGVQVTSAHIYGAPIAEYVLRAALDHLQQAAGWRAAQRDRAWRPHELRELSDTTWLVVGQGDVGGQITATVRGLGARVIGVSRRGRPAVSAQGLPGRASLLEAATPDQVPGLLPGCDVVVLARPTEAGEPPLVDSGFLHAMAPGSLLVNVARGSLIDEAALLPALDEGRPGYAVLDVCADEPLPATSPIWAHPRITLTPHSAGQGTGRYARGAAAFSRLLADFCADYDRVSNGMMPL